MDFAIFYKIAESAPVKLTKGHGTLKFDFVVTDTDHFPIAPARPLLYMDLLPHLKRVGAKYYDPIDCHFFSFLSPDMSHLMVNPNLSGNRTRYSYSGQPTILTYLDLLIVAN